ncbi:MAG: hypothetical protein HF967_03745 [Methanosarcinales archaeon]|nr:hypothetical protein [Methanosarcinales archaeon]
MKHLKKTIGTNPIKLIKVFFVLAILLFSSMPAIYATATPTLPAVLHGTITINGIPAPVNTTIEAIGVEVQTLPGGNPWTVTVVGEYRLAILGPSTGTEIQFKITTVDNQILYATEIYSFIEADNIRGFDLTVIDQTLPTPINQLPFTIDAPGSYILNIDSTNLAQTAIVINSNDVILDGNWHILDGADVSNTFGVASSDSTNITIKNLNVNDWDCGISFSNVSNGMITNVSTSSNLFDGISLTEGSNYNMLSNIITSLNAWDGIWIRDSNGNALERINSYSNRRGIMLSRSSNAIMRNNIMYNNTQNFGAGGIHDIDVSNTVNGKSIIYLINESNVIIDSSSNAGVVYVINGQNIIIKNLILNNNLHGVFLSNTENSVIENIYATSNDRGLDLRSSSGNTISNVTVGHSRQGILMFLSDNNSLLNVSSKLNGCPGTCPLQFIDSNKYVDSNIENYEIDIKSGSCIRGIWMHTSHNNTLSDINISLNRGDGILLFLSNDNTLSNVIADSNDRNGIHVRSSNNNVLTNSNIANNKWNGYVLTRFGRASNPINNRIYFNNFIDNTIGNIHGVLAENHFNSSNEINYLFNSSTHRSHIGNYYSTYGGVDLDGNGIGDTAYQAVDNHPLIMPIENYEIVDGVRGDINGDETVNAADVTYLDWHIRRFPGFNIIYTNGDINGDETVNAADVTYLDWHIQRFPGFDVIN